MDNIIRYSRSKTVGRFRRGYWDEPKYVQELSSPNPIEPLYKMEITLDRMTEREFKVANELINVAIRKLYNHSFGD